MEFVVFAVVVLLSAMTWCVYRVAVSTRESRR